MGNVHRQLEELIGSRRRLAGRYRIETKIGAGAYGMIFFAVDAVEDRKVAVKAIPPSARERSDTAIARFQREMKVIRNLEHPNIVTLYDWGTTDDGLIYMVLEYIEGKTLDAVVRDNPMDEATAVSTLRQLASALDAAHNAGVIHRDLKPANVMVARGGDGKLRVKVLDFGMAKLLAPLGDESIIDLTREGMAVGTPRYIAPEQARGRQIGPPADMYAVGLLMYEMFTGVQAVKAETVDGALRAHVSDDPLQLDEIEAIPERMRSVLFTLLEKDPERRIQSATVLSDLLQEPPDRWRSVLDDTDNVRIGPALGDVTGDFPGAGKAADSQEETLEMERRSTSPSNGRSKKGRPKPVAADTGPGLAVEASDSLELAGRTPAPQMDDHHPRRQLSGRRRVMERSRRRSQGYQWFRPPRTGVEWAELALSVVLIPVAFLAVGAQAGGWGFVSRFGVSLVAPVVALVWAMSRDSGEWRKSFGRRCWTCCLAAIAIAHLLGPEELATELVRNPTWFLQPVQGVPGVGVIERMATWFSQHWAGLLFDVTGSM